MANIGQDLLLGATDYENQQKALTAVRENERARQGRMLLEQMLSQQRMSEDANKEALAQQAYERGWPNLREFLATGTVNPDLAPPPASVAPAMVSAAGAAKSAGIAERLKDQERQAASLALADRLALLPFGHEATQWIQAARTGRLTADQIKSITEATWPKLITTKPGDVVSHVSPGLPPVPVISPGPPNPPPPVKEGERLTTHVPGYGPPTYTVSADPISTALKVARDYVEGQGWTPADPEYRAHVYNAMRPLINPEGGAVVAPGPIMVPPKTGAIPRKPSATTTTGTDTGATSSTENPIRFERKKPPEAGERERISEVDTQTQTVRGLLSAMDDPEVQGSLGGFWSNPRGTARRAIEERFNANMQPEAAKNFSASLAVFNSEMRKILLGVAQTSRELASTAPAFPTGPGDVQLKAKLTQWDHWLTTKRGEIDKTLAASRRLTIPAPAGGGPPPPTSRPAPNPAPGGAGVDAGAVEAFRQKYGGKRP